MAGRDRDAGALDRDAPGRELREHQSHGLYLFEEAQVDAMGQPTFGYRLSDGKAACCSRKASKPGRCESNVLYSNGRCVKHGGKSLKASASPTFKHGKDSKFRIKGALDAHYQRFLDDPELTHHRESAALVEAMAQELLAQREAGGTPRLWKRLLKLVESMEAARRAKNYQKAEELWQEIRLVVEGGGRSSEHDTRVVQLLEAARRHKDSETKRKLSEEMTFTYEEASAFYGALGASVRRHVLDETLSPEEKLHAIENDMAALAGQRQLRALPGAPEAGDEAE